MKKRKKLLLIMASLSLIAAVLLLWAISLVVGYEARGIVDMPVVGVHRLKFKLPIGIVIAISAICRYTYAACFSRKGKIRFEKNEGNLARDAFAAMSCADVVLALAVTYLFDALALIMAVAKNMFIKGMFVFAVPFSFAVTAAIVIPAGITAYRIHKEFSPET